MPYYLDYRQIQVNSSDGFYEWPFCNPCLSPQSTSHHQSFTVGLPSLPSWTKYYLFSRQHPILSIYARKSFNVPTASASGSTEMALTPTKRVGIPKENQAYFCLSWFTSAINKAPCKSSLTPSPVRLVRELEQQKLENPWVEIETV